MKRFSYLFLVLIIFANSTMVLGQYLTVENNRLTAVIHLADKALSGREQREFNKPDNYKFYELIDAKGVNIRAVPLDTVQVESVNILQNGFRINLNLNNALQFGKIYLLKINNATINEKEVAVLRLELNREPTVKVYNEPRDKMRVESNVELSQSAIVSVNETILKISEDKKSLEVIPFPVPVKTRLVTPTLLNVEFRDRLSEGRNHYLKVELQADDGTKLSSKGKVTVPGLPASNPDPKIEFRLSSEFGGNLKPQFNLAGVLKDTLAKSENDLFYFEPILTFDVGLGATKSKNNITLELPTIKSSFDFPRSPGCRIKAIPTLREDLTLNESSNLTEGKKDSVRLPCFSEWKNRHPLSLYSVDFRLGPKFETDKKFSRVNLLTAMRLDFNFDRWQHSLINQRSYLQTDLKNTPYQNNVNDILIKFGFTLTPRLGVELGRKLTTEVIENKAKTMRAVIPQHPIFRTYAGISAVFEWNYWFLPVRLSVSQDLYHLAYPERSGEIKFNLPSLRTIRGFQPIGKATLDFALDTAKRYNFSISYENGRSAPSFEYLNTIKTGFRILY